jgi:hypothetical protein
MLSCIPGILYTTQIDLLKSCYLYHSAQSLVYVMESLALTIKNAGIGQV